MPVSAEEILKDYRRAKRELEEERRRETMRGTRIPIVLSTPEADTEASPRLSFGAARPILDRAL